MILAGRKALQDPPPLQTPSVPPRKRKRSQETEPPQKRKHVALTDSSTKDIIEQPVLPTIGEDNVDPIRHWVQKRHWAKEYFELNSQDRESLNKYLCHQSYLDKQDEIKMAHLLARAKSTNSLRRKQSGSSNATPSDPIPSDQQSRENKNSVYMTAAYNTILATKGSYMGRTSLKITDTSKALCGSLLVTEQTVPQDTLFRDDLFDETCNSMEGRNEALVLRHISPLICPSPLVLRIYGAKDLECLTESINEGWNSAIPVVYSRPQPDYSVGFARSAFTDIQLEKLKPFVGEIASSFTSYFLGTWRMYFPFLTCEVKCGAAALDVADRQNAHSMTIAVRAVVELFRYVKREKELHREILAFSISHDHRSVRIYGHYPVINENNTTFYRHSIHTFDFTALDGREKWTAYKFTKNVYDVWMPEHLRRICSAIDAIPPDINFEVSRQSELQFANDADLQLSRELEGHQSNADSTSAWEEDDSFAGSQDNTATSSFSREPEFKRPRNTRAVE
ncbi:hypothetical protein MMC11_007003 [Xylographa trunciseda]|nr:hypothetical protein [Xylographa trunciseda]